MGQIVVRRLDDAVLEAVKLRAAENNRSTEAEVRAILSSAVGLLPTAGKAESRPSQRFSDFVGIASNKRSQQEIDDYVRLLRAEWER